jgi:nucleotide-binding universal stress UspA family protein
MLPKDLVVFLEPDGRHRRRLQFAAALAKRWQAHLIATFVTPAFAWDPHAGFAVGRAVEAMSATHRAHAAEAAMQARRDFDSLCARRSFSSEWRMSEDEAGEDLVLHARHACFSILGPPAAQRGTLVPLGLSEDMVFASGRPCLLLPDTWQVDAPRVGGRVVVGWNGSREATRAIAAAMPFLMGADAVRLVVVPQARGGAVYGDDPGADMAAHLARHGVPVVVDSRTGADAGEMLLQGCAMLGADLLVMGAMGRSRISEFVFGGATRTVFSSASVPLLVAS